jgi:hypothetical protein
MSFLQPLLLIGLPLALVPIIIHLIHSHRRRTIPWAAMRFLRAAQRLHQGLSKLRQYLILALRTLAILAVILMAGRPLAGGLLGLTGGTPDTVILLVDRSASMQQQTLATGQSKLATGLQNLADSIATAYSSRSRIIVIDSATLSPRLIDSPDAIPTHPNLQPTTTSADIPALLQAALDYVTTNQTGRTDLWLLSDLRQNDWDSASGRWENLRSAFATLAGLRFHLLSYPQAADANLALQIQRSSFRRGGNNQNEILLDLSLTRSTPAPAELEIPLRITLNGVTSTQTLTLPPGDTQLQLQAYSIPVDPTLTSGHGLLELPMDANPADNLAAFVFSPPPPLTSVIVSSDPQSALPLQAALSARLDPGRSYQSQILPPERAAEIDWPNTALIIWQAPIPAADDILSRQLQENAAKGLSLLFLPASSLTADSQSFGGLQFDPVITREPPVTIDWWRTDADLLANTRAGTPLQVQEIPIQRHHPVSGDGIPLAKIQNSNLLQRSADPATPNVWFLGTLPSPSHSALARNGVIQFAMLHRALQLAAPSLGNALQKNSSPTALGPEPESWSPEHSSLSAHPSSERPLQTGVFSRQSSPETTQWIALNRPMEEDNNAILSSVTLRELFKDLDLNIVEDNTENSSSLASEIWRTFLLLMAIALILEALLCLPAPRPQALGSN